MVAMSPIPLRSVPGNQAPSTQRDQPRPVLRLFTERVMVNRGTDYAPDYHEIEAPLLSLAFRYGADLIEANDPSTEIFAWQNGAAHITRRQLNAEREARRVLESFGAVDLDCVDDIGLSPNQRADYMVTIEADADSVCAFGAYALPQLRKLGWEVEVRDSYRWRVVGTETPWYAKVNSSDEEPDWFSLELGIEIEGRRLCLLPAILELLDHCPTAAAIEALVKRARRCIALPVGDGEYVAIPPARLRVLARVLVDFYDETTGTVKAHCREASWFDDLDGAFAGEAIVWDGDREAVEKMAALTIGPTVADVQAPASLKATLRPYQLEGLAWLQHLRAHEVGGVLADDMGLGKTLQTIAHIVTEKEAGRLDRPCLVITPTSLIGNWQRELRKFAPVLSVLPLAGPRRHDSFGLISRCDVILTTYPLIIRDKDKLADTLFHQVILDEAQTIKNPRSRAHRAVKSLAARHRLCLSGTPVENNLEELWSLFDFVSPGHLGDANSFRSSYRVPIERDGKVERLGNLRERIAPYILRRTKATVAKDLPPKTELIRPVELEGEQRELYESIRIAAHGRVRQAIQQKGFTASTITILDALMKLRQACCDPRLVKSNGARGITDSAKYNTFFEMVTQQRAQGHRILVFSQFTSMLALLADGLDERRIAYSLLTGNTADRQKQVDAFESGKTDVFLISLKAGGTGLNLTSADTVIHYDPWWNPAAQAQATDRAYRIGQQRPVFVYNLIVAGSVEERMVRLQGRKRQLADGILSDNEQSSLPFTEGELDGLFAPLGEGDAGPDRE